MAMKTLITDVAFVQKGRRLLNATAKKRLTHLRVK